MPDTVSLFADIVPFDPENKTEALAFAVIDVLSILQMKLLRLREAKSLA